MTKSNKQVIQAAEIKSCIMWLMSIPEDELDNDIAKLIRVGRRQKQSDAQIRERLFKTQTKTIENLIKWQKEL